MDNLLSIRLVCRVWKEIADKVFTERQKNIPDYMPREINKLLLFKGLEKMDPWYTNNNINNLDKLSNYVFLKVLNIKNWIVTKNMLEYLAIIPLVKIQDGYMIYGKKYSMPEYILTEDQYGQYGMHKIDEWNKVRQIKCKQIKIVTKFCSKIYEIFEGIIKESYRTLEKISLKSSIMNHGRARNQYFLSFIKHLEKIKKFYVDVSGTYINAAHLGGMIGKCYARVSSFMRTDINLFPEIIFFKGTISQLTLYGNFRCREMNIIIEGYYNLHVGNIKKLALIFKQNFSYSTISMICNNIFIKGNLLLDELIIEINNYHYILSLFENYFKNSPLSIQRMIFRVPFILSERLAPIFYERYQIYFEENSIIFWHK